MNGRVLILLAAGLMFAGYTAWQHGRLPGQTARSGGPEGIGAEITRARADPTRQQPWPPGRSEVDGFDPVLTRDNVMVVLDMSGSMGEADCAGQYGTKAAAARDAFAAWLSSVDADTNVGLVVFSGNRTHLAVPLGRGAAHRGRLVQAVNTVRPDGGTPLSDAVAMARAELEAQAHAQQGYGTYRMVVVTDGQHSDGYDPRAEVTAIIANRNNPIEVHSIGFCIRDSALNVPGYTFYHAADNPTQLREGLGTVLAETEFFDPASFESLQE